MADRDPRIDPQPGDVLENSSGTNFYVLDRSGDYIAYQEVIGEMSTISLAEWQICAKDDTIIKRSGKVA